MIEINKTFKELRKEIWKIADKYKIVERLNHIVKSIDNDTPAEIVIKLYDYLKDGEKPYSSYLYTDSATLLFNALNIELPKEKIASCCFFPMATGLYEKKSFADAMSGLDQKINELHKKMV